MRTSCRGIAAAILSLAVLPAISSAAPIFSDGFDTTASSTNYSTFITQGATGNSGDATFGYNYGAAPASGGLSIPLAPHTTDSSTTGLRLRTDNLQSSVATAVGATEITTKGLVLPAQYQVQVDVWSNYIGGTTIAASGTNGSTGVTVGIGSKGTSIQYIAGNDGALVEAFGDNGGGANSDYRLYNNNTHALPTDSPDFYAAPIGSNTDPYYTSKFPSVTAPAAQATFATTQSGSTAAGTQGFAWHTWTITQDGTNITWAIDGLLIGTIPDSKVTLAGQQISLGNDDTGLSGSSVANNQLFNAEIFDNLVITAVPEPTSIGLLSLGCIGLLGRRRKNA